MRYRIDSKIVIKSENAAKSYKEKSLVTCRLIESLVKVDNTFDYGCGKLRYLEDIAKTTEYLSIIDSTTQLRRNQKIIGRINSIEREFKPSNKILSMNIKEFTTEKERYQRGFCINVLSAIPIVAIRNAVIGRCFSALEPKGTCIFVLQYRNSDCKLMANKPNARLWRDGILIDSLRGHSFYALIKPKDLYDTVKSVGFKIEYYSLFDGSIYLIGQKS